MTELDTHLARLDTLSQNAETLYRDLETEVNGLERSELLGKDVIHDLKIEVILLYASFRGLRRWVEMVR